MQNNIDKIRAQAKWGAVIWGSAFAVVFTAMLIVYLAAMAAVMEMWIIALVVGVYVLILAAVVVCVIVALRQRLKELDSDEFREYQKY